MNDSIEEDVVLIDCSNCEDLRNAAFAEADERRRCHDQIAKLDSELAKSEFRYKMLQNKIRWLLDE